MPPTGRVLTPNEWEHVKMIKEFESVVPAPQGSDWWGLVIRPNRLTFVTQNKGEKVYALIRKHWLSNIGWVINDILYTLIPIVIIIVLGLFGVDIPSYVGWRVYTITLALYYSFIFTGVVRNLVNWYFNIYLVTNERLIAYKFNTGTVSKSINETRLDLISDVKGSDAGILAAFFDLGNLTIFTEAERNQIVLSQIPEPTLVRDIIADLAKVAARYAGKSA